MAPLGLQGQLEGLILAILQRGALHGYAIASGLRDRSGGVLDVPEGTLYPILHRLEREGLIRSRWEQVNGRRRRVYSATSSGGEVVQERFESWQRLSRAIDAVFAPSGGSGD